MSCACHPTFLSGGPTSTPSAPRSTASSDTPPLALVGVGHTRNDDDVGIDGVRHEGLGPIYDVMVPILNCHGANGAEIAPRFWLGHANREDRIAGDHAWDPARLLLIGAVLNDVGGNDAAVNAKARPGTVRSLQLFGENRWETKVLHTSAAVFLGS